MTPMQQRMCGHKRRHPTMLEAGEHAEDVYQRTGHWLRIYKCRFCLTWHVGH